jgi:hypothetical protein
MDVLQGEDIPFRRNKANIITLSFIKDHTVKD